MATRRSNFDHDELQKLTDKGLKPTADKKSGQRANTEEIRTSLKTAAVKEQEGGVQLQRLFHALFGGFLNAISGLFATKSKEPTGSKQCEIYGHNLQPGWTGPYPTCLDCKKPIYSLDEVRGSTPLEERRAKPTNPYDKRFVK